MNKRQGNNAKLTEPSPLDAAQSEQIEGTVTACHAKGNNGQPELFRPKGRMKRTESIHTASLVRLQLLQDKGSDHAHGSTTHPTLHPASVALRRSRRSRRRGCGRASARRGRRGRGRGRGAGSDGLDVGGHEGAAALAGVGARVVLAAVFEGLLADEVGDGVLVLSDIWRRGGAVVAGASELEVCL